MKPTVFLFDIDGTLVTTGGVGRRSLQRVFKVVHGNAHACEFPFDGMTDRAIVRQGLRACGRPEDDAEIEALFGRYIEILQEEVKQSDPVKYRVHPGMREALDVLSQREEAAVGLGTGNIREGAKVKLGHVGLYDRFEFGGFGCDHEDRPTLIRIGAERGAERLGVPLASCRVVVIGDTPKDVSAAAALGADCIGVGTGSYRPDALLACGAQWAFDDLSDPRALTALLDGR